MQHADKLTEGQMKAFESYADYRIDVYPTSAECRLPDAVRAVSGSNSKMINGNEGIEWNTLGGMPFPNPTEAQHYIWNHRSAPHYNASIHRTLTAYIVKNDGTATVGKGDNYIEFPGALNSPLKRSSRSKYLCTLHGEEFVTRKNCRYLNDVTRPL